MISSLVFLALVGQPLKDQVEFSFGFFGCNRIQPKDWKATKAENPSSANIPQLNQTWADLASLNPKPSLVFAAGDLVVNYETDQGETLAAQLEGWQKLVMGDTNAAKLSILPLPGNHELNQKDGDKKLLNPATQPVWQHWIEKNGYDKFGSNGPTASNDPEDELIGDQSKMSFTFVRGDVEFIVLNTDSLNSKNLVGWIPAHWAAKKIAEAEADAHVKDIFVVGHRNLDKPVTAKGDSPIEPDQAKVLIEAISKSKKTRAYVCAHVHAYDFKEIAGSPGKWQIISGNGGSLLDDGWIAPIEPCFGFITVQIYRSGRVGFTNYRRPLPPDPKKYFVGPTVAAKADPEVTIFRS